MAPFRWPHLQQDIDLLMEVATHKPEKIAEWETIAVNLSSAFSTDGNVIEIKGRACRERVDRLILKFNSEDAKALKRSGTEEECSEMTQLLQDIVDYKRDMSQEKIAKKKKAEEDRKKGEEMRRAALEGLGKRRHSSGGVSGSDDSDEDEEGDDASAKGSKKKPRRRASKMSALDMLSKKYEQKTVIKEQELEVRRMELEFQKRKYEAEAEDRKSRMELEMEERRTILTLLKDRL